MTEYVLGFYFNDSQNKVILIKKTGPEWQAGKFNGVGGKIEPKETPLEAMTREFKEEVGIKTYGKDWGLKCILRGKNWDGFEWKIFVFFTMGDVVQARTCTDEKIEVKNIFELDYNSTIDNLRWLIPMCLENHSWFYEILVNE